MATAKAQSSSVEELQDLNQRVAEEAAATTTAKAKGLSESPKESAAGAKS